MRDNNWYIDDDGTIKSRNRNGNPHETVDDTNRTHNNLHSTDNIIARVNAESNIPITVQPVTSNAWERMDQFAKLMTIIQMIVCFISLIFFAATGIYMGMAEKSITFTILIYAFPIFITIMYLCKLQYISDCAYEWICATGTACLMQMLLRLIKDPEALIIGGVFILFAAFLFLCAVIGTAEIQKGILSLLVSMVSTPMIIIGLFMYSPKTVEYPIVARFILMAPTAVMLIIALYKTYRRQSQS